MSFSAKPFRKSWKPFCDIEERFIGTQVFSSEEDVLDFIQWYDGDLKLIGTQFDERTWKEIIKVWKESSPAKNKKYDSPEGKKELEKLNINRRCREVLKELNSSKRNNLVGFSETTKLCV